MGSLGCERHHAPRLEAYQNQRKIKPVTLVPDPVTHKIRAVTAMPLFKIDESSTLFSRTLQCVSSQDSYGSIE